MGEGSMTGAGAIVTRNTVIGEGEVYVGVPARLLDKNRASQKASQKADQQ